MERGSVLGAIDTFGTIGMQEVVGEWARLGQPGRFFPSFFTIKIERVNVRSGA